MRTFFPFLLLLLLTACRSDEQRLADSVADACAGLPYSIDEATTIDSLTLDAKAVTVWASLAVAEGESLPLDALPDEAYLQASAKMSFARLSDESTAWHDLLSRAAACRRGMSFCLCVKGLKPIRASVSAADVAAIASGRLTRRSMAESLLQRNIAEQKKQMPQTIDDVTTATDLYLTPDTLCYVYTLADDFDCTAFEANPQSLHDVLLSGYQRAGATSDKTAFELCVETGRVLSFYYRSANGAHHFRVTFPLSELRGLLNPNTTTPIPNT